MDYSVKRKELLAYIDTESILGHALILSLKSTQFFTFSLFLSLFFSSSFFCSPYFFPPFVLYTMAFLPFPPYTCGSSVGSPFFPLLLLFLESSILSCNAAHSLFRYHLHINAARGLAGQHLMRRQQYPQIFVFSHPYLLFDIFSFTLWQGLPETFP